MALEPVIELEEILKVQKIIKEVHVSDPIKRYIVEIVRETRQHPEVFLGASPRGSLGLFQACQARAAILGRDFVLPDDVKLLAPNILSHRVVISPAARLTDVRAAKIIHEILDTLAVPNNLMGGTS